MNCGNLVSNMIQILNLPIECRKSSEHYVYAANLNGNIKLTAKKIHNSSSKSLNIYSIPHNRENISFRKYNIQYKSTVDNIVQYNTCFTEEEYFFESLSRNMHFDYNQIQNVVKLLENYNEPINITLVVRV